MALLTAGWGEKDNGLQAGLMPWSTPAGDGNAARWTRVLILACRQKVLVRTSRPVSSVGNQLAIRLWENLAQVVGLG